MFERNCASLANLKSNLKSINLYYAGNEYKTTTVNVSSTTTPSEIIVVMDDNTITYKLATPDGIKPFIGGARAKILEIIKLYDVCKKDSTTIVADVGAELGDFGNYAAACGCSVHMFEPQPTMYQMLERTIKINAFFLNAVHLYNNVVNDLETNTAIDIKGLYPDKGDITSATIYSMHLDDVEWSSSIFLLRISAANSIFKVLRSGERLFREKRVQNLILYYDTVKTGASEKQQFIDYLKNTVRPRFLYTFHPKEDKLYGPVPRGQWNTLANRKHEAEPIIGLFISMNVKMFQSQTKAESYVSDSFFS